MKYLKTFNEDFEDHPGKLNPKKLRQQYIDNNVEMAKINHRQTSVYKDLKQCVWNLLYELTIDNEIDKILDIDVALYIDHNEHSSAYMVKDIIRKGEDFYAVFEESDEEDPIKIEDLLEIDNCPNVLDLLEELMKLTPEEVEKRLVEREGGKMGLM